MLKNAALSFVNLNVWVHSFDFKFLLSRGTLHNRLNLSRIIFVGTVNECREHELDEFQAGF